METRRLLNQQYEAWTSVPTWHELVHRVISEQGSQSHLLDALRRVHALPISTTNGAFRSTNVVELPTSAFVLSRQHGAMRTIAALSRYTGLCLSFQDFRTGRVLCSDEKEEHTLAWEITEGGAQQTVKVAAFEPLQFEDTFLSCLDAVREADVVWCVVSDVRPREEIIEDPFHEFLSRCLEDAGDEAEWVVLDSPRVMAKWQLGVMKVTSGGCE